MRRIALGVLVTLLILTSMLWSSQRAVAQVLPPERTAATGSAAWGFSGSNAVYSVRVSIAVSRDFDLAGSYHWQNVSGGTASLYGVGIRYHFAPQGGDWDAWVAGGYAAVSGPALISGLSNVSLNATGGFGGLGGSIQLADRFLGYGSVSILSLSGATNGLYDAGVQYLVSREFAVQVGYLGLGSSGGGYLGLTLRFP